jgi:hypothetical protein
MAVVTPIFVLLVFGLIEFGRALMIKQAMTDAARAGSRTATLATKRLLPQEIAWHASFRIPARRRWWSHRMTFLPPIAEWN